MLGSVSPVGFLYLIGPVSLSGRGGLDTFRLDCLVAILVLALNPTRVYSFFPNEITATIPDASEYGYLENMATL